MEEIRFNERVAVVTGSGGGLGRSYALMLASLGAKVVVNDLGGEVDGTGSGTSMAEQAVEKIRDAGGEAVPNFESVADWKSAQKVIDTAIDNYGRIDILINNAGILRDKSMLKMDIQDWELVQKVHLWGSFFCTKAAMPHMREQDYGRIVFVASDAGLYGNFGQTNYSAAKLGIVGLMNAVKLEGAKHNILANTIVPAAGTRMTATVMPPEILDRLKPECVAPMVAWLCSEQCKASGMVITAGAGYFSRAAVVEGPGVFFSLDQEITADMVAEKIDQIMDISGAKEFNSATEKTMSLASHLTFS